MGWCRDCCSYHSNDYDCGIEERLTEEFEYEIEKREDIIEILVNEFSRAIDGSYHALLEMTAWLGIPEKKRMKAVEHSMENILFIYNNAMNEIKKLGYHEKTDE